MKKPIVDILIEHQGGVTKDGERYILHYETVERKDGQNYYHTHHKDVTYNQTEIESDYVDYGLEDMPACPVGAKKIGIRRIAKIPTDLEHENQWLFVSVLQGILKEDATPVSPVYINKMLVGDNVEECAVCYVTGGKKELKYRKLEY